MKEATLLVLNPSEQKIYKSKFKKLQDYYDHIKCDAFDVTRRVIGGKRFNIFCDDIGLFADEPWISAISASGEPILVGNLVFSNTDNMGNTISLTPEDITILKENIVQYTTTSGRIGIAVMCDYE